MAYFKLMIEASTGSFAFEAISYSGIFIVFWYKNSLFKKFASAVAVAVAETTAVAVVEATAEVVIFPKFR